MNSKLLSLLGAVGISLSASQSVGAAVDFIDQDPDNSIISSPSVIFEEISLNNSSQEEIGHNGICANSGCS